MRSDLENPGTVIKTTSRGVDVELDEIAFADLLSDAKFYATSEPGWFGPELSGIVKSAKATLRILTS